MSSPDRGNESSLDRVPSSGKKNSAIDEQQAEWQHRLVEGDHHEQLQTLMEIRQSTRVAAVSGQMIRLAGSRDDGVRAAAAEVLDGWLQPSPVELPALIASLADRSDGEISYWAATLLGRLGKKAVGAVPALCDVVAKSQFLPARERSVWALREIGPEASDAIPVLGAISEAAPARLQQLCREAIRDIGIDSAVRQAA